MTAAGTSSILVYMVAPGESLEQNLEKLIEATQKIWQRIASNSVQIKGVKKNINGTVDPLPISGKSDIWIWHFDMLKTIHTSLTNGKQRNTLYYSSPLTRKAQDRFGP